MVQETLAAQEEEDPEVRKETNLEKKARLPSKTSFCGRHFYALNFVTPPPPQPKRTPTPKHLLLFMHLSNTYRKVRWESDLSEVCIFINIAL